MVFIEAAKAELPVVTTDVGCIGEVLIADQSCLTFPQNDVEQAVEKLLSLEKNPELSRRLCANALQAVLQLDSREVVLKKICDTWKLAIRNAQQKT
jgi:glycosyltransferase involved in cell wall biosynthesis